MASSQPLPLAEEPRHDAAWSAAVRAEEWAGELRVNLIRLAALAVFYVNHLINYYVRDLDISAEYHLIVTSIAAAWAAAALLIHVALAKRGNPRYLKYAALGWDVFMTTSLIVFSNGPRSPFLILLLLIIISASLRLNLRLVWIASLAAALSYGIACGHSRWVRPETRVPVEDHVIFLLALATGGLFAGQCVRQSRRFAQNHSERLLAISEIAKTPTTVQDDSPNQEEETS